MIDYSQHTSSDGTAFLQTSLRGSPLVENPLLNKGTAFSPRERAELGLAGLLPPAVETLGEQAERRYHAFRAKTSDLERHIFLRALQDQNETLFYRLLTDHLEEMMPIVYTPVVGAACQQFSAIYRRPRGLFVAYPDRDRIAEVLANRPYRDVDVVVVTDGERILGLGDQGAGGMGIPIGKLSLYTACGGIHPGRTLPITLDVGTNNADRLADQLYLGWRHERIRGAEYDDFVDRFVTELHQQLPNVLLQWEDFANPQAFPLLARYRDSTCSFNDDIQGTAAVTLSAVLAALRVTGQPLASQRIVLLGAGSAGAGICQLILDEMVAGGVPRDAARAAFYALDSKGLVYHGRPGGALGAVKEPWARAASEVEGWTGTGGTYDLLETVRRVRPTVLIGVSTVPGAFTEAVVREMARQVDRPIIFPLSNPTSKIEATPADLLAWTDGRALVATGSPFEPVSTGGRTHVIGQCNNSYIFPGVGLGVLAVEARRVTDGMFLAAARALAACSPGGREPGASLLPALRDMRNVSLAVATAVGLRAVAEGVAPALDDAGVRAAVERRWWSPEYLPIYRSR